MRITAVFFRKQGKQPATQPASPSSCDVQQACCRQCIHLLMHRLAQTCCTCTAAFLPPPPQAPHPVPDSHLQCTSPTSQLHACPVFCSTPFLFITASSAVTRQFICTPYVTVPRLPPCTTTAYQSPAKLLLCVIVFLRVLWFRKSGRTAPFLPSCKVIWVIASRAWHVSS